jgi:hypothetical protein
MNFFRFPRFATTEVILFFSLWLVYGMTINSRNLNDFNLQQAGVEAMVERHHFYLEGSATPELQGIGDTFVYQGHTYANKHPGQFMAGAAVYLFLYLMGLRYANHYLLVAALVTFFTAALATAAGGLAVFKLSEGLSGGRGRRWAILGTFAFGFATTAFPYSGIAHHDAIASGYLIVAFYLIFSLSRAGDSQKTRFVKASFAGLLLGLTITTSMLPFFMAVTVGIYFLAQRQWKLIAPFVICVVLGLLPMLIYDAVNFGNPFLLAAIANYKFTGYDPEAFFHFDWNNFVEKMNVYAQFVTLYAPVLWLGLLGLFLLPRKHADAKYAAIITVSLLVIYVTNIQGLGTCMYGPRYILPVMPFACLGFAGLPNIGSWKRITWVVALVVFAIATLVNLVGALRGAMYCNLAQYAFPQYLSEIKSGQLGSFPLVRFLLPVLVIFYLLLLVTVMQKRLRRTSAA